MATFSRSATLEWSGDVPRGIGTVAAGSAPSRWARPSLDSAASRPVQTSHLSGEVEGLAGVAVEELPNIARVAEEGCTITAAIRATVAISVHVVAI